MLEFTMSKYGSALKLLKTGTLALPSRLVLQTILVVLDPRMVRVRNVFVWQIRGPSESAKKSAFASAHLCRPPMAPKLLAFGDNINGVSTFTPRSSHISNSTFTRSLLAGYTNC